MFFEFEEYIVRSDAIRVSCFYRLIFHSPDPNPHVTEQNGVLCSAHTPVDRHTEAASIFYGGSAHINGRT